MYANMVAMVAMVTEPLRILCILLLLFILLYFCCCYLSLGLDRVKLPSNREHRRALQHVMEW